MNITLEDRIVSALSYLTFGIFSIIWIIFTAIMKKKMTPFIAFNIYQAIFVSVILAVISLIYDIAINLLSVIPIIGGLVRWLNLLINQTPMFFTFTLTGLIVTIFITILALISLYGKRPLIPFVSDAIKSNFGG